MKVNVALESELDEPHLRVERAAGGGEAARCCKRVLTSDLALIQRHLAQRHPRIHNAHQACQLLLLRSSSYTYKSGEAPLHPLRAS